MKEKENCHVLSTALLIDPSCSCVRALSRSIAEWLQANIVVIINGIISLTFSLSRFLAFLLSYFLTFLLSYLILKNIYGGQQWTNNLDSLKSSTDDWDYR
jgi:hypothetical protein